MSKNKKKTDIRILQGLHYLYWGPNIVRIDFTFNDEIDCSLMQKALTDVIGRTDWLNKTVFTDGVKFCLRDVTSPIRLFNGDGLRAIPDETDGYMFYFSVSGNMLILFWEHFIFDGRGARLLLNEAASEYCKLKYNIDYIPANLKMYIPDEYMPDEYEQLENPFPISFRKTADEPRAFLTVDREKWITRAVEYGVKPFTLLSVLTSKAAALSQEKDRIVFNYAMDSRKKYGYENYLFNITDSTCVEIYTEYAFSDLIRKTDDEIRSELARIGNKDELYNDYLSKMGYAYRLKISAKAKNGLMYVLLKDKFDFDIALSYIGNAIEPHNSLLNDYVVDSHFYVFPHRWELEESPFASKNYISAVSVKNKLNLNICALGKTGEIGNTLKNLFESENIPATVEFTGV